MEMVKTLGTHNILEFYGCNNDKLNDKDYLESLLINAAKESGATVISSNFHLFNPQGISGVVIIAESHFTIHTWTEYDYAAIDIFTCGKEIDIDKAIPILNRELECTEYFCNVNIPRGIIVNDKFSSERRKIIINALDNTYKLSGKEIVGDMSWHGKYEKEQAWGILASIDVKDCDPDLIRDADYIKQFVVDLCDFIQMKRFGETVVVNFGEDEEVAGFSMIQLIETSLISGHFANKSNASYVDIFSCKYYSPEEAALFTNNYFKGKQYKLNVCVRKA